ncbi:MAG: hypothetical protein ACPGXK_10885 [Phycisphaerae bacterium]
MTTRVDRLFMMRHATESRLLARRLVLLALCLGIGLPAGCTRDESTGEAGAWKVERNAEEGGNRFLVQLSRDDVPADQPVTLRMTLDMVAGLQGSIPEINTVLEEAELDVEIIPTELLREDPILEQNDVSGDGTDVKDEPQRLVLVREYRLDFVLPGEYELPEITAGVRPENDDGKITELTTEPVTLLVREVAGSEISQEQWGEIQTLDPISLPKPWSMRYWWVIALALLGVLLILVRKTIFKRFKQWAERPPRPAPIMPAHEWARAALQELVEQRLIEKGQVKEFHYRVSFIVRGYIERRYDVLAGEMTTEEFLATIIADRRFGPEITAELRAFHDACDLVKYARHESSAEESQSLVRAAETFVDKTWRHQEEPAESLDTAVASQQPINELPSGGDSN